MNMYIRRLILAACIASSTVPVHAGWASAVGSYVSEAVSGWFSQSSDRTTACMAALGAAAVGLSAYFIYKLWKKQDAAPRAQNPAQRANSLQLPPLGVEPVRAPCPPHLYPVPEPRDRQPDIKYADDTALHQILPVIIDEPKSVAAPLVPQVPAVAVPVVSCPAPQPYLSWEDQRRQGENPQIPVVVPRVRDLQEEIKVNAAQQASAPLKRKLSDIQEEQRKKQRHSAFVSDSEGGHQDRDIDYKEISAGIITQGAQLEALVRNGKKNELTVDEARAVLWKIWCDTAPSSVTQLTFKIKDTPDRRLYNALRNCKKAYPRLSSHFPGQVYEGGVHYGIDMHGLPLPEKTTIVFAPLITPDELREELGGDTLFYLKPEDHGCENPWNVFWEQGLLSSAYAASAMALHGYQYAQSNIGSRMYSGWHDGQESAKERVPDRLAHLWRVCLADVECDADTRITYEGFAHQKSGAVYKMLRARGVLQAKRGKESELAQNLKEFEKALVEVYPEKQLKHVPKLNGRELFYDATGSKPMLVDLESRREVESPRALSAAAPQPPQPLALDHKERDIN